MDGRLLTEIIEPTVLAAHAPEKGEPLERWPSEQEAIFYDETMSEEDEAEIRDRLQALGYLE
jgi:hypothetical protein